MKIDKFSVQVKYTGNFDDYKLVNWKDKALNKMNNGVDCYDDTIEVEDDDGRKLDWEFTVENTYPCNKIATVYWFAINDDEEEF